MPFKYVLSRIVYSRLSTLYITTVWSSMLHLLGSFLRIRNFFRIRNFLWFLRLFLRLICGCVGYVVWGTKIDFFISSFLLISSTIFFSITHFLIKRELFCFFFLLIRCVPFNSPLYPLFRLDRSFHLSLFIRAQVSPW